MPSGSWGEAGRADFPAASELFQAFHLSGMKGRQRVISIHACLDDACGYDMREALALPFVRPGNPLTISGRGAGSFCLKRECAFFPFQLLQQERRLNAAVRKPPFLGNTAFPERRLQKRGGKIKSVTAAARPSWVSRQAYSGRCWRSTRSRVPRAG